MKKYITECYIATKDKGDFELKSYFTDKRYYDEWCKHVEQRALEEFYEAKIIIK